MCRSMLEVYSFFFKKKYNCCPHDMQSDGGSLKLETEAPFIHCESMVGVDRVSHPLCFGKATANDPEGLGS